MTTTLYSTFSVDDRYVGIPVDRVQEVLLAQPLTPVPLAHRDISGLLNLRGQIVTSIDLRARMGLARRQDGAPSANVIITTDGGPVALLVDRLGDVLPVDDTSFEPPPDTLAADLARSIKGAFKLDDALLLDLDLDEALNITT
jgi:purine-binding chemotaxis protein CheW